MNSEIKQGKRVSVEDGEIRLSLDGLGKRAGSLLAVLTLVSLTTSPFFYYGATKPIADIDKKVADIDKKVSEVEERSKKRSDDLEKKIDRVGDQVGDMKTNVAVILERTERQGDIFKRQEDSLASIRRFLENKKK